MTGITRERLLARLNISAAMDDGIDAARQGQPWQSNPYPNGTAEHESWFMGWKASTARQGVACGHIAELEAECEIADQTQPGRPWWSWLGAVVRCVCGIRS